MSRLIWKCLCTSRCLSVKNIQHAYEGTFSSHNGRNCRAWHAKNSCTRCITNCCARGGAVLPWHVWVKACRGYGSCMCIVVCAWQVKLCMKDGKPSAYTCPPFTLSPPSSGSSVPSPCMVTSDIHSLRSSVPHHTTLPVSVRGVGWWRM